MEAKKFAAYLFKTSREIFRNGYLKIIINRDVFGIMLIIGCIIGLSVLIYGISTGKIKFRKKIDNVGVNDMKESGDIKVSNKMISELMHYLCP